MLPDKICPHCKSNNLNKAGFTHNKKQRFYCRDCRRFSRANPISRSGSSITQTKKKKPQKPLPSQSHLILKLKALSQKLDRTPTTADIIESSKNNRGYPLDVYYAVFGSFTAALKRAKIAPRYNQEFDKEKLIAELKKLRRRLKRALIGKDVQKARDKGQVSSIYHFQRAFGSVPKAIAEADAGRKNFTKEEIRIYLGKLQTQLQRAPTGKDINTRFVPGETPSLKEILRLFGTLSEATRFL